MIMNLMSIIQSNPKANAQAVNFKRIGTFKGVTKLSLEILRVLCSL